MLTADSSNGAALTIAEADLSGVDFGSEAVVLGAYELGPNGSEFAEPLLATFDTGIAFDTSAPIPLVVALTSDDGETWEPLTDMRVAGGEENLTARVPLDHFSVIVFLRGDHGVYLDPEDFYGPVGAIWDAYFDIYDARFAHLINEPARRLFVYDEAADQLVNGRTAELREAVGFLAGPVSTGVVEPYEDDESINETGTYFAPTSSVTFGSPGSYVEVIYGENDFTCVAAGDGAFGFAIDVSVGNVAFLLGVRTSSGGRGIIRQDAPVVLYYEVAAPARCLVSLGQMFALLRLYMGVNTIVVNNLLTRVGIDPMSDHIWSRSITAPGWMVPRTDLIGYLGARQPLSQLRADFQYNFSVFECGTRTDIPAMGGPVTTLCANGALDVPEGDVVVVAAQYADRLPVKGDPEYYTYAAVFETNDDPSDDWQAQGFDWDYYLGTDRWYEINFYPDAGSWALTVRNTAGQQPPSGVRALLAGDTIIWVIPADEFAAAVPEVRVTAFAHEGDYDPATSGGDVSGADPTEALYPVEG